MDKKVILIWVGIVVAIVVAMEFGSLSKATQTRKAVSKEQIDSSKFKERILNNYDNFATNAKEQMTDWVVDVVRNATKRYQN